MSAEIKRHIVVFLVTGQREEFRDVNAYAFVGPNDRDLELHDRDWDNHVTRRIVAYFPAGGWIGLTWDELDDNPEARKMGFRVPASEH
jgi:hypothetical protein